MILPLITSCILWRVSDHASSVVAAVALRASVEVFVRLGSGMAAGCLRVVLESFSAPGVGDGGHGFFSLALCSRNVAAERCQTA